MVCSSLNISWLIRITVVFSLFICVRSVFDADGSHIIKNVSKEINWKKKDPWLLEQCVVYINYYGSEPKNETAENATTGMIDNQTTTVNVTETTTLSSTTTTTTTTTTTPITTTPACTEFELIYDHRLTDGCFEIGNKLEPVTPESCLSYCNQTAGCTAFTWSSERSPTCRIYAYKTGQMVTGVCKRLTEYDYSLYEVKKDCRKYRPCFRFEQVRRVGGSYGRWSLNSLCISTPDPIAHGSVSRCRNTCAQLPWCKAFEYKADSCRAFASKPQNGARGGSYFYCDYFKVRSRLKLYVKKC